MINREKFYNGFPFRPLNQSQVDGLNFLLQKLDDSPVFNSANEYAYILATIKHETAESYKPITELGGQIYLRNKKYYPYIGRGFVQLTWDWNYDKFGKLLNIPLLENPKLANEPETAWKILELGMSKGLYTGKSLGNYVTENKTDYTHARKVINGMDCATTIASYAVDFEKIIEFIPAAQAIDGHTEIAEGVEKANPDKI